jgi:hypothetical protein
LALLRLFVRIRESDDGVEEEVDEVLIVRREGVRGFSLPVVVESA